MRVHITIDDDVVAALDRRAGRGRRSAMIVEFIRRGLEDEQRWDDVESALGALDDVGHEWDGDPAAWVRAQRNDVDRTG